MQLLFGIYKNNIYKKQKIKHIAPPLKMLGKSRFLVYLYIENLYSL